MKTSSEIYSAAKLIGEERAIETMAKAGFDAWDFSMSFICKYDRKTGFIKIPDHPLTSREYLRFARQLRKVGKDNGITCNQSHAPFPTCSRLVYPYLQRAIECTAEAGGNICVIHPDNNRGAKENAEMFFELLPFAKQYGVKIATENMWNWYPNAPQSAVAACSTADDFVAHVDAVNDPFLVACLDIGHAEMRGSGDGAVHMIHALGNRLQALHLHDNDLLHDSHQIPFSMDIDFDAVVRALKDIGYDGYFTLEADMYLSAFDETTVTDGIRNLACAARKLADMFDAL